MAPAFVLAAPTSVAPRPSQCRLLSPRRPRSAFLSSTAPLRTPGLTHRNAVRPTRPRASAATPTPAPAPTPSPSNKALALVTSVLHQAASLSLLLLLQRAVTLALAARNIVFPPPLAAMLLLLSVILVLRLAGQSRRLDAGISLCFSPAVAFLSRWLAVFFVPNLVMLPLAPALPSADLSKLFLFIPLAFLITMLLTASVSCVLRALAPVSDQSPAKVASAPSQAPPSNALILVLTSVATSALILAARAASVTSIPARVYATAVTLLTFSIGLRLPPTLRLIFHPLIVCTFGTISLIALLASVTATTFPTALSAYLIRGVSSPLAGGGNVLAFLLGPAVITFAFIMDKHRALARARIVEVVGASLFAATASLFGTAAAARLVRLSSSSRLILIPRTITAPLAVPIASLIGADLGLAASVVAITGLLGANFGRAILSAVKVSDPVVRGLAMGASAHGLGTAALGEEQDALPFAALAMTLVGVLSSLLVAISPVRSLLIRIALAGMRPM